MKCNYDLRAALSPAPPATKREAIFLSFFNRLFINFKNDF